MKVASAEGSVALWTLALSSVVSELQAFETEYMIALCENGVLLAHIANITRQLLFVHPNFFLENLTHSILMSELDSV